MPRHRPDRPPAARPETVAPKIDCRTDTADSQQVDPSGHAGPSTTATAHRWRPDSAPPPSSACPPARLADRPARRAAHRTESRSPSSQDTPQAPHDDGDHLAEHHLTPLDL